MEALKLALVFIVVGVVLHFVSLKVMGSHNLNDMKMYAVHLGATAVVAHLLLEAQGVNKWYCKNGVACRS
jgi:hypothetical protein